MKNMRQLEMNIRKHFFMDVPSGWGWDRVWIVCGYFCILQYIFVRICCLKISKKISKNLRIC